MLGDAYVNSQDKQKVVKPLLRFPFVLGYLFKFAGLKAQNENRNAQTLVANYIDCDHCRSQTDRIFILVIPRLGNACEIDVNAFAV